MPGENPIAGLVRDLQSTDAIAYLDDWKGPTSGGPDDPVFFAARVFDGRDRELLTELFDLLAAHEAARWHASGRGRRNLFHCSQQERILELLGTSGTRLFAPVGFKVSDYLSGPLSRQFEEVTREAPELGKVIGSNAYLRGLYRFSSFLAGAVHQEFPGIRRLRVIGDTIDQIASIDRFYERSGPGFHTLFIVPGTPRTTIDIVVDKKEPSLADHRHFLGLVDSEAWAFGRVQGLELDAGDTILSRGQRIFGGELPEAHHPSGEEIRRRLRSENVAPGLVSYWATVGVWTKTGLFQSL